MRHLFLGLDADEWSDAEGGLPVLPYTGQRATPEDVRCGVVAMLRRLSEEHHE